MQSMLINRILVLVIAAAWDLIIGDPKNVIHPVQIIGKLIDVLESAMRRAFHIEYTAGEKIPDGKSAAGTQGTVIGAKDAVIGEKDLSARKKERLAGGILTVLVAAGSTACAFLVTWLFYRIHPAAGVIVEGLLCGQMLAMKSLKDAAESVRIPLTKGDTEGARHAVSMIVGRDTQPLDEAGITRAAVETVAENTSDGIIAPLLFEILFGAPGAYFYKSVNTMDSMIGYKNDRYQYFGTAAAKLDDVINFLPSRIAAVLMICAAGLMSAGKKNRIREEDAEGLTKVSARRLTGQNTAAFTGMDAANASRIWKRDRRKHPSPNSAQTESVCAGALHLALAGPMYYFGVLHKKPWIGDDDRPIEPEDIRRSEWLMEGCAMLTFFAGLIVLAVITAVFTGH